MYGIRTSVLNEYTYSIFIEGGICHNEQEKYVSYSCKYQQLINKLILKDYQMRHKNSSIVLLDYKTAFDNLPHTYLEIYKTASALRSILSISMRSSGRYGLWIVTMNLLRLEMQEFQMAFSSLLSFTTLLLPRINAFLEVVPRCTIRVLNVW